MSCCSRQQLQTVHRGCGSITAPALFPMHRTTSCEPQLTSSQVSFTTTALPSGLPSGLSYTETTPCSSLPSRGVSFIHELPQLLATAGQGGQVFGIKHRQGDLLQDVEDTEQTAPSACCIGRRRCTLIVDTPVTHCSSFSERGVNESADPALRRENDAVNAAEMPAAMLTARDRARSPKTVDFVTWSPSRLPRWHCCDWVHPV